METPLEKLKPRGEALEELIGSQALNADLKTALFACLTGRESRRWTVGELFDRLNNLGLRCSKPALAAALGELELEMALCPFLPWNLVERGTEWSLVPKTELLELLSAVRKLPGISCDTLTDEHKAVLLVVIGYRHKGGVSKTRIGDILKIDPSSYLHELWKRELVYTAPEKELKWWRPTPQALLTLGLRSYSEIPELKELERYFDRQKSLLELLSDVRLPGLSSDTLTDKHKAVLLVVLSCRRKGSVSKTRIQDILKIDPSCYLNELSKMDLICTAPGKEINCWRPTPQALQTLGVRSYCEIPELKELDRYFDSHKSLQNEVEKDANMEPVLEKAEKSRLRRRRRELQREASVPRGLEPLKPRPGEPDPLKSPLPHPT